MLPKKASPRVNDNNKLSRLVRAKQLLKDYPKHLMPFIWFTDEKIFTGAPPISSQNDRLYAPHHLAKKQLSPARLSVGVPALGCTNLIFVEPGVKINGQYYRD